ncbi:hypothetical protein HC928_25625 [bacterium]|nr:hypothetical protein [bacterium]
MQPLPEISNGFYNGSASRSEKGLEISGIAVVDVAAHRGYTLSVQQTPTTPGASQRRAKRKDKSKSKSKSTQTFSRQDIERICDALRQLPEKPKATQMPEPTCEPEVSRIDHYLAHLNATHPYFPVGLKYLVADGFYSKQKFVDGVVALN